MNEPKITLADIIGMIAALVYGSVCFLSKYFETLGHLNESILYALPITVVLWGLSFSLKFLKKASHRFCLCLFAQLFCLIGFLVAAFWSSDIFAHFFSVSKHKDEIERQMSDYVQHAKNLFATYDFYAATRIQSYERDLHTAINGKKANYHQYLSMGFRDDLNVTDNYQLEARVKVLMDDLLPEEYKKTKEKALSSLDSVQQHVKSWNPLALVNDVNDKDLILSKWKNQLEQYASKRMEGENAPNFLYPNSFDPITTFFTQRKSFSTPWALGLALVAHLCMLLSWLITPKHPRNTIHCCRLLAGRKGSFYGREL